MIQVLKAMSWVAGSLFIVYKTTAVYEYFKMFVPSFFTKMKDYEQERKYDYGLSYKMYMMTTHDSFLMRLVTCPYCFGVWLSTGFSWYFSCLDWLPAVYLGGILLFFGVSALFFKLESMNET